MFKDQNRVPGKLTNDWNVNFFLVIKVFLEIIDYSKLLINYDNRKINFQKESRN